MSSAQDPSPAVPDRAHDRTFLGWAAFGVAVAALFLGVFGLAYREDGGGEAAAGPGGAAAEVSVIDIELGSMKFVPSHIMAPPGRVQLNIINVDSQVHNLEILGFKTADLQPGQSELLDLGNLDVGVYDFWCEIPGHREAGMVGELHIIINAVPGPLTGTTADGVDHFHGFG